MEDSELLKQHPTAVSLGATAPQTPRRHLYLTGGVGGGGSDVEDSFSSGLSAGVTSAGLSAVGDGAGAAAGAAALGADEGADDEVDEGFGLAAAVLGYKIKARF